eukprot:6562635-Pyramimonas_sp.AAC.1
MGRLAEARDKLDQSRDKMTANTKRRAKAEAKLASLQREINPGLALKVPDVSAEDVSDPSVAAFEEAVAELEEVKRTLEEQAAAHVEECTQVWTLILT